MTLLQLNPTIQRQRRQIENFLASCLLRYDDGIDYYAAIVDDSDNFVAGGGLDGNTIKCLAVAPGCRGENFAAMLVSHLIAKATECGCCNVRLFTKPSNQKLFENLSFRLLAKAPEAILMETGPGGIDSYKSYLRNVVSEACQRQAAHQDNSYSTTSLPEAGVIVMNCNPFTLGHRYLIEQASHQVKRLYVIIVKEDCSMFSYEERKAMISRGVEDFNNVVVCDGSDYAVSATTFPTYFIKEMHDTTETQILLDLYLYKQHIAPALGATVRFVGTEPTDPLTNLYNSLMSLVLTDVRTVERLQIGGRVVSASRVRRAISRGSLPSAASLVPPSTLPYIVARLATRALHAELDTTPKPGLVDRHDNGSHTDMDYRLMDKSITTLLPTFVHLAQLGMCSTLPSVETLRRVGLQGERDMLAATKGVNTYKGALFSLGLAVVATTHVAATCNSISSAKIQSVIRQLASGFAEADNTHGSPLRQRYNIKGALCLAREGYPELFSHWLPFYRSHRSDTSVCHVTLLHIMSSLDDTNILHRTDMHTLCGVRSEAAALAANYSTGGMEKFNRRLICKNISPGGSADMLALTIFIDSATHT